MGKGFEVFLIKIAAAAQEQDSAAGLCRAPVDPPDPVTIRRKPTRFNRSRGNGAAVNGGEYLANFSLPAVVTVW